MLIILSDLLVDVYEKGCCEYFSATDVKCEREEEAERGRAFIQYAKL